MKKLGKILGALGLVALFMTEAMAQSGGVAAMISGANTQFQAVTDLISTISYIAGIGFLFKAILKFKEHNESKGQVPLSNAIVLFVVAGLLLTLPYIYSVSSSTVSGAGANKTGIGTGALRQVS